MRENAQAWVEVLEGPGPLRQRPDDDRWSALEYAGHVRDVFLLYDDGARLTIDSLARATQRLRRGP